MTFDPRVCKKAKVYHSHAIQSILERSPSLILSQIIFPLTCEEGHFVIYFRFPISIHIPTVCIIISTPVVYHQSVAALKGQFSFNFSGESAQLAVVTLLKCLQWHPMRPINFVKDGPSVGKGNLKMFLCFAATAVRPKLASSPNLSLLHRFHCSPFDPCPSLEMLSLLCTHLNAN